MRLNLTVLKVSLYEEPKQDTTPQLSRKDKAFVKLIPYLPIRLQQGFIGTLFSPEVQPLVLQQLFSILQDDTKKGEE
jgi:hypothetical protein